MLMHIENPFAEFRKECERILAKALEETVPEIMPESLVFEKPANPEFGQLASSTCFEIARHLRKKPIDLAKTIVKAANTSGLPLVERLEPAGEGYINFYAKFAEFSALALETVIRLDKGYGLIKSGKPQRIIVEHTSANPIHPIHVGTARNPILGDTIARLLKTRGHDVFRHYYIDDVGRQTSVVAYGYEKLGMPKPKVKPDHFVGWVYTITSCLVEISRLKKTLEQAKASQAVDDVAKINMELDAWVAISAELQSKYPQLFEELLEKVSRDNDPEYSISKLNKTYEEGAPEAKKLVQKVTELCFSGFKQTLNRIGVSYDSWDWEGELVASGLVSEVVQKLRNLPYVFLEDGALKFNAERVTRDQKLKAKLGLRKDYEIPSLTLARSDGTTLYTTRDIAYTLWKFEKADKVINVIGMDQNLAQLQLKIALYALGFHKYADNLVHFAYNLVSLQGYKMSSRRGRYITFDEVMDEAVKRAFEEVSKRSPRLSKKEKQRIAEFVGVGAVRYALVEVDASKPVLFTWDRILNFERNSAPYIQYTHARACSILRKANTKKGEPAYRMLSTRLEKDIVIAIADLPDSFVEAAEYLKPSALADYVNGLADKFNTFYNASPVIRAEPPELRDARLSLVEAVKIVLRNSLNLIGVYAPERM